MHSDFQRASKILFRINELASVSEDVHGITRTFGTAAFLEGRQKVLEWMKDAGLETRIDNMGNLRAVLRSGNKNAKTFVIASHIDTVVNAGKFDGPLGVLMGLDLLEQLVKNKTPISFHIELIAFSDEEGVRFHTTFLGSKVVAGSFDNTFLTKEDRTGTSLAQVLKEMDCDEALLEKDAIPGEDWLGYFEMHIEQGPVLYERDVPVAVVTGIAGQKRVEIIFKGMAGHAGTVPMDKRSDALAAAAAFILETEAFALANKNNLVATVGKLEIADAASNVIPGKVTCSLDVRSHDEAFLTSALHSLQSIGSAICEKRNCYLVWSLVQETAPVYCDERMGKLLENAIRKLGFELVKLVSGAGHDAVPVSVVAPVAMLFVRCFKGISHNPLEDVELKDIAAAVSVADQFMLTMIAG